MARIIDPFSPISFGSRPSFAAYWPDTRFVELHGNNSDYFQGLLGRKIRDNDEAVYKTAESVIHHEKIHWQVAHSLSWGLMRSALFSSKTTIASFLFRHLSPNDLVYEISGYRQGSPVIARNKAFNMVQRDHWSGTTLTIAEHCWALTVFNSLIDHAASGLSNLRPPSYLMGLCCQYLRYGFNVREVLFEEDHLFHKKVKSFKKDDDIEVLEIISSDHLPSPHSIEECLAMISQLHQLRSVKYDDAEQQRVLEKFEQDILDKVFCEHDDSYAHCFNFACSVFDKEFDDLNLSLLALICQLSLDPALPFQSDGSACDWSWHTFHPSFRFERLIKSAKKLHLEDQDFNNTFDDAIYFQCKEELLIAAKLSVASDEEILNWLGSYDENASEWPSEELALQHIEFSKIGRKTLNDNPGMLFSLREANQVTEFNPYLTLPYVLIDGQSHVFDERDDKHFRQVGEHALNGLLSRMTEALAFGNGFVSTQGLPRHEADVFTSYQDKAHEFFQASLHIDLDKSTFTFD